MQGTRKRMVGLSSSRWQEAHVLRYQDTQILENVANRVRATRTSGKNWRFCEKVRGHILILSVLKRGRLLDESRNKIST